MERADDMRTTIVREMQAKDFEEVVSFARLLKHDSAKKPLAMVALVDGRIAGYAEMAETFFGREFVALLSVRPKYRRQGVATALMKAMEANCRGPKLFTSTNRSNQAMRRLLAGLHYHLCGTIDELDEDDPEWIFVKHLASPDPHAIEF